MTKADDIGSSQDDGLDLFFAQARAARPEPGDDLVARVLAEAGEIGAEHARRSAPPAAPPRSRWRWPAWAGDVRLAGGALAASLACGLWIGATGTVELRGYDDPVASADLLPELEYAYLDLETAQ
ncbi:hypothetical protein [Roseobacter sp. HKCCA0434]|uniref:hypothetical protein n=1 Tax=Roseobacter sp. HKCCA0434 TaxID=3079297 RepID=UPI002905BE2A|nr:hypothetical protein [Roseobacter sp. HKCCA0434]